MQNVQMWEVWHSINHPVDIRIWESPTETLKNIGKNMAANMTIKQFCSGCYKNGVFLQLSNILGSHSLPLLFIRCRVASEAVWELPRRSLLSFRVMFWEYALIFTQNFPNCPRYCKHQHSIVIICHHICTLHINI